MRNKGYWYYNTGVCIEATLDNMTEIIRNEDNTILTIFVQTPKRLTSIFLILFLELLKQK